MTDDTAGQDESAPESAVTKKPRKDLVFVGLGVITDTRRLRNQLWSWGFYLVMLAWSQQQTKLPKITARVATQSQVRCRCIQ